MTFFERDYVSSQVDTSKIYLLSMVLSILRALSYFTSEQLSILQLSILQTGKWKHPATVLMTIWGVRPQLTQEALEFPSFCGCIESTATHGSILSERNSKSS